ncbi:MAG TPA: TonB-dependent receptor [Candidatus Avibacteroides faecavium]|nr:TonB-dependent receptor [Candidatus Avibacteroides faecavium]
MRRHHTTRLAAWLTAMLAALCVLPAAAQNDVTITGVVTDDGGAPVEFATVHVERQVAGTMTNLKGEYSLQAKSTDSVVVVFSMLGYNTRKRVLKNPQGKVTLNVMLPHTGYELGEVTVTEAKRQTGTMQDLDFETTHLLPSASGGGIEAFITTQAGVSSNNELSSQYNVRGGSFDENIVYVNGIEVYRPMLISSGQQEGLSFINPDMVENVGFSSGGYEAKYGDKMASVLDITYKRPEAFEATAAMSLLGASGYVGVATKRFTMTHGIRYKTNRYLLGTMDTKGEYDPNFVDYQTYITWRPTKRFEVGVIGNFSQNRYNFVPENRTTRFGTMETMREFQVYFDGAERDLFRTYFGAVELKYRINDYNSVAVRASAFRTNEQETYDIQGQYWLSDLDESEQPEEGNTSGVGTYLEHARNFLTADVQSYAITGSHKLKAHSIDWGLELKHEKIDERMREWEMRDSAGYSLPHLSDRVSVIYNLNSTNSIASNRFSFYVQDTYKFKSAIGLFTINLGVRGSYWGFNKEFIFSPRGSIGLIPAFNDNFTFRIASGLYYQAPFYKEFRDTFTIGGNTDVRLNRDIKSQRSVHFVAAADYKFRAIGRPFKVTVEAYYKKLSNLIPYNVDNVKISYYGRNISHGYAAGLDFKLFGEFVKGTDSWITFSVMKTRENINGKWVPRPTDQRYNLSVYFTDYFTRNDRWKLSLKGSLADGLPFGAPHSGLEDNVFKAPSYKRIDVGMSYRLLDNEDGSNHRKWARHFRNIWLGLDCFNLFGINNVNSYYWVTDVYDNQFAVPNYLTGRQINVRLLFEFR